MSTLSSSSSRAAIFNSYIDNASYEEDHSVAKCKAFITACTIILSPKILAKRSEGPGDSAGEIEFDVDQVRQQLDAARAWLGTHDNSSTAVGGGNVKHVDFDGFRD